MKKKILLTLILVIFIFNILGVNIVAIAADTETNKWDVSKNGDGSVIATLDENGTMTIEGNGEMKEDYNSLADRLYYSKIEEIKKVEIKEEVTSIGNGAFSMCRNLENITIHSKNAKISNRAFSNNYNLKSLYIPDDFEGEIEEGAFYNSMITYFITANGMSIAIPDEGEYGNEELSKLSNRINDSKDILYCGYYNVWRDSKGEYDRMIQLGKGPLKDLCIRTVPYGEVTYNICAKGYVPSTRYDSDAEIKHQAHIYNLFGANEEDSDIDDIDYLKVPIIYFEGAYYPFSEQQLLSFNIEAEIHLQDGDVVTNNNGKKTYLFKENGEFTFEYRTKDGENKTVTAKVTNIDRKPPKITKAIKSENDEGKTVLTVYADDGDGGMEIISLDNEEGKVIYETKKERQFIIENNEKRIGVGFMDDAGNWARRTIDVETCAIIGDVNEDGDIDFKDMLDINKHRLSEPTLKGKNLVSADVNSDGEANFKDMLLINKFRLGKIENFE